MLLVESEAFAPGHITGFVEFPIKEGDPLSIGSRGAGVCIDKGVITRVSLEPDYDNDVSIYINDRLSDAEVSMYVIDYYLKHINKKFKIIVKHYLDIPIGYGLGSSGAAALSLSLALNDALQLFDNLKAAQIAHIADLECRCGMGTVTAEYYGGLEMRLKAGAPGVGYVKHIDADGYKVVILCLKPVSTKEFLTNKISFINGLGGKMLYKLDKEPSIERFLKYSSMFARSIKFVDDKCYEIMDELEEHGYYSSLAMFGETVFTIVKDDDINKVNKILTKYGNVIISSIDSKGARVIDTKRSS
ncbi:MAG: kinase [Candidatus Nitrosocaldaceae archaeon]|nr:MAG: kinase [Candidatus Nitrosocaldaceae archaeon]